MPPSYNISDLPYDIEGPVPAPTKEDPELIETRSIVSTQSSIPASTVFRGKDILLTGLAIVFPILILLLGLFIQIFVAHEYLHQGPDIITAAPLGSTLALVHALAVFLILTLPVTVGLQSYRLAWAWLTASVDNGHNRPTPFQLGIIMNLLHGANFSALWGGMKYMYGIRSTKRSSFRPPLLRLAMFVLAFALFTTYGFALLDVAVSIASTPTSLTLINDYPGDWPQLSRQINVSMCATTSGELAPGINLCGLQTATGTPFAASLPEALSTLTNNSATNAVAFGNDGTAFIVPAAIPEGFAYSGNSYGVLSDCQSITSQCVGSATSYGSDNSLTLNCPASAAFNATFNTTTNSYPFGILDGNGDVYTTPYLVNSNPFNFGGVVQSQAYNGPADSFVGSTGFFVNDNVGYNVLSCSVTVRNIGYTYFNGSFTIDPWNTSTASDLGLTRVIGAMTSAALLQDRIPDAIEGAGLTGGDYSAAFGRELSRELIAYTSSLYIPAAPLEVQIVRPVVGSRLPLPLLVLMLIFIAVYCIFALALTVSAVLASSASPYTLLARARLAEPLTAVHTAYGRSEPHRTWERSNERLFSVETGSDRLSVGPTTSTAGGLAFGVSRAGTEPSSTA